MYDIVQEQLKRHEGLRLKPYKCTAGKLTIGYGRNLQDVGISKDEAEVMLEHDIKIARLDALHIFTNFDSLSENRQAVLVNMAFNLGYSSLKQFKKFITAVTNYDFAKAKKEMLDSKWANQVGNRAKELSDIMLNG